MFQLQRFLLASSLCLLAAVSLVASSSTTMSTSSSSSSTDSMRSLIAQRATQQITHHILQHVAQDGKFLQTQHRQLQAEDFMQFVDLFSRAVISLPDFETSETILFASLNLKARNVKCFDIVLSDVVISHNLESNQRLSFQLNVNDLDITCTMDYNWDYSFLNGNGQATIALNDNFVSSTLAFASEDFDNFPPSSSTVEACNADITVSDMSFSGSVTDSILNVFESLLRGFVEDAVSAVVCEEVGSLGTTLIQDMIDQVAEMLDPYLLPLNITETNATAAELAMVVPNKVRLLDFQEEDGEDQLWVTGALKEIDAALGVWLINPEGPREGGKDLGINIALRESLLDANRAFILTIADLPFDFDPILFEGHDDLTQTIMSLDVVRVYGLDTFNEFAPFINKGKYTLQNDLGWDYLSFELDVTLDMKPSTLPDSIIDDPGEDMHIIEKATLKFGVDDINATISVLMAIDQDAFGAIKVGALLKEENILPCFMASVFHTEITVLQARVGQIREPSIDGFIDKGIDNVVTNAVEAAFKMYESVVIKAMPNIFQLTVKDIINESLLLSYDEPCPEPVATEKFIDFRDLFLAAQESQLLGGSGTEPYGSIAPTLFDFLKTQIATVEGDGTLSANSMFIRPFTNDQSGVDGMLHFPGDLFSLSASDIDFAGLDGLLQGFHLGFSDVRALNLDTLIPPFEFLKATSNKHALDNELHLGPVAGRPLNISAELSVVFGEDSPLAMNNNVKIGMTSSAFEIIAQFVARIQTKAVMNFPIKDVLDIQCWLATMPAPDLNDFGFRVDPNQNRGISLTEFANKFSDLNVVVECANCTSIGFNLLPTVFDLLKETDVTSVLASRLKFLVDDIIVSDTFQTYLDRMLEDAGMSCPHHPDYSTDAAASSESYAGLPLPELSATSIDTIQFVLGSAVQVGFVVFTQMYADTEVNPADSLSEQEAFEIPEGSNLINFKDFDLGLPSYLRSALDGVLEMITGTGVDPITGQNDLSINIFMRDFLDGGIIDLSLDDLTFGPDEMELQLHRLLIEGLDTFKRFDVGVAIANQTILNDIEMETLSMELDFTLRSGDDSQRIQLAFQFDDVNASLPLFAAIDMELTKNIQVGSLLRTANILPCLLSSVYGVSFPSMLLNVGKIHKPRMTGLMPETSASLQSLVDTLFLQYETAMHESLPSVIENAVRPVMNSLLDYFVSGSGKGCSNPLLDSFETGRKLMRAAAAPFVDFRDLLLPGEESLVLGGRGGSRYGDLFFFVWGLVEDEYLVINTNGHAPINTEIIGALTESDSTSAGELFFPGDLLNTDFELDLGPFPTGIVFRASDIRIQNLDTVGNPFSILDPVKDMPSLLNNTATIGVDQPLRVGVNLFVDISSQGTSIRNDFDISADFHTATLVLTALLKLSEYRFAAFPIGDLFNLDCWMAAMPPPALDAFGVRLDGIDPSVALEELKVSMQELDLNITCRDCSSPGLVDLAELWSTPGASADITNAANSLLEYIADVLGDGLVQTELDRMLNNAARRCPHSPEYQKDFSSFTFESFEIDTESGEVSLAILVMVVGACLVAILAFLVFVIRFITRRRHKRWLKTLPSNQLVLLKARQDREEEKEAELNAISQSMLASDEIPSWVRWAIPVIIIGNIGLFMSGHLSLAAEVSIVISLAGQVLRIEEFYQFSMARSTMEIWQAGGKELAILILIFSGIWPYTKQLITLVLWFLPTSYCSISRRGSILLWLDALAKWSIVDIFTLVMSVAAFRVSVSSPNLGFLTDDLYSLDLLVVPMWGLYANLIAQILSQISSHFIIHYHRNILHEATKVFKQRHGLVAVSTHNLALTESSETLGDSLADDPYGERKDLLHTHAFERPHRGESVKLVTRPFVNGLFVFGALVFVGLLIAGCALPSSGLEFQGVLGVAVESGQDWKEAVSELSLFDLVGLLMDQARFTGDMKDFLGHGFLSALLIITVLLVPLVQTATLMYQWFVPMAGRNRKRMSVVIEMLQAWQYAEVYIISIVVATWQLGPISVFMINSYCSGLQDTFDVLAFFGILSDEDAQCFKVDATIESAAYILAVAAVLLSLLNTFVMNATKQYFRDRDESITRAEWKAKHCAPIQEAVAPSKTAKESDEESEVTSNEGTPAEETMASDFQNGRSKVEESIKPVPVLFTDKFRWVLCTTNVSGEELAAADELAESAPLPTVGEETAAKFDDGEQPSSPTKGSTTVLEEEFDI